MEKLMTRKDADVGVGEYDSIAWIFDQHIKEADDAAIQSAVVHGFTEDNPTRIELYSEAEPLVTSVPVRVWYQNEEQESE